MNSRAISLRELAFVRDVLIPRAWVQGSEVDDLLRLRTKIDGIFTGLREEAAQAEQQPQPPERAEPQASPDERKKRAARATTPAQV